MRTRLLASMVVILAGVSLCSGATPELQTEEQKTLYAIGLALSNGLTGFGLSEAELELVKAGLTDGVLNREKKVDLQVYGPKIQEMQKTRMAALAATEKKAGQAFLDRAAAEKGATKTASGSIVTTLRAGTGPSPKATDTVTVHYHGTLIDGTVFDSSVQRGKPATFPLNQVIKCWTEGVQLMKVGGKAKLTCPPGIAYGKRGAGGVIPPDATLNFEIELLEIAK